MTREEAVAEAERKQAEDPEATYRPVARGDAWAVARIGVKPPQHPAGTATKPPPEAPPEGPPERPTSFYGSYG